jgi:hypothetical protein
MSSDGRKTIVERVLFGLSLILFFILNLVPGLLTRGAHAFADYGGGGGGGACPGDRCGGSISPVCCSLTTTSCYKDYVNNVWKCDTTKSEYKFLK